MIPTVTLAGGWETLLEGSARAELERMVLPEFLRRQRWFGGKGRVLDSVRFVDWGEFSTRDSRVFLLLLEVRFADEKSDWYFLPIGVTNGSFAAQLLHSRQPGAIARLIGPEGEALLYDALADMDACLFFLAAIGDNRSLAMHSGRIDAFATTAYASLRGDIDQPLAVECGPATSSNTLIVYGRRLMLKLFRRLEPGINPDFEMGRFLSEGNRFDRLPIVAGAIEYHRSGSASIALAILQCYVVNQGDGWRHALDELSRYYERVSAPDARVRERCVPLNLADSPPPQIVGLMGDYLQDAATLGRRTAEMHRALIADPNKPDFCPELFTPVDAETLRQSIRVQADEALAALRYNLQQLPPDVVPSAQHLLEDGIRLLRNVERVPSPLHAVKIRCHGDYHLGQVLRVDNDYIILDFEGEPVRTVAERRAKQSPLKDVAGMVRSYHYAAYAGLFVFTLNRAEHLARFAPWAECWFQWASAAFLRAYRNSATNEAFLPAEKTTFAALLDAFMLDRALYELNYELNNRPDWVRIPLRGILALLEKGSTS